MTFELDTTPAPAILFVRSKDDLPVALTQVNRFLAFRRNRHARDCDDIVAVCFRRDPDITLPPLHPRAEEAGDPNLSFPMYETFSFAGIWTLVWLRDLTFAFGDVGSRTQQRELMLRRFMDLLSRPDSLESVHPVFARDESIGAVPLELTRLKKPHFRVKDIIRFRQGDSREVYCESEVDEIS